MGHKGGFYAVFSQLFLYPKSVFGSTKVTYLLQISWRADREGYDLPQVSHPHKHIFCHSQAKNRLFNLPLSAINYKKDKTIYMKDHLM